MERLTRLTLNGFKSIQELHELTLEPINVLVGPNGSGKSNLIFFFKMLSWMMASFGNLQDFIGRSGGANALLCDGSENTPQIEATLTFETENGQNEYYLRLSYAAQDTFIFTEEKYRFSYWQGPSKANWKSLGAGHQEAQLIQDAETPVGKTTKWILRLLRECKVYQFHNTSETARIRRKWNVSDHRYLKEDGANLAPFLLRLQKTSPKYYRRIVETIRQIAPFFQDFVLEPEYRSVMLRWQERDSDYVFGPHQASDGTLRAIAIIALLLQPEEDLPAVLILDEPELGLHPYAIQVVAGLLKSISSRTQVILATQSRNFVDYFDAEDIIVVDRSDRYSTFRRLDSDRLKDWLDEYSVGELWEKNVIGGRP